MQIAENLLRYDALVHATERWAARIRELRATPTLSRAAIVDRLARYDFVEGTALEAVARDVEELLRDGAVQSSHPRYFGLFNPTVHAAGVVADAITALYNPQLGGWWHAPAAAEIERATLSWFVRRVGFDPDDATAMFTGGGSEANHMAVLVALTRRFAGFAQAGARGAPAAPDFYASDQAHDSLLKIAHASGLGRAALRRIASDAMQRLDVHKLRAAIAADRAEGLAPFLVVATAGTTATGAIDPLAAIADVCGANGLSLHVDAAWGGAALLTGQLAHHLAGIERADSITWDAHKTLPVPMAAGMFLARGRAVTEPAFHVRTGYVPDGEPGTIDLYQHSLQWSRRFIGLKVFMTLAERGERGIATLVDRQVARAALLRTELAAAGWSIENASPLPIVCFSHPALGPTGERVPALVRAIVARGEVWVSEVRYPDGRSAVRACITNVDTTDADVHALLAELGRGLGALL